MPLCIVEGLTIGSKREKPVVDQATWQIEPGECKGLIGESGSGKSLSAKALIRLTPLPILSGKIRFKGTDLLALSDKSLQRIRGREIGMVLQDSLASLNPLMSVGDQVREALMAHEALSSKEATHRVIELFEELSIPEAARRYHALPYQLSGGQRQRVAIAMGICCRPALLIADEPTTALDVTIQAQILQLFKELQKKYQMAILLITHDMGVVAACCDKVVVMQHGKVIETGDADAIFASPKTVYTEQLIRYAKRQI